jgi:hypothetical protein
MECLDFYNKGTIGRKLKRAIASFNWYPRWFLILNWVFFFAAFTRKSGSISVPCSVNGLVLFIFPNKKEIFCRSASFGLPSTMLFSTCIDPVLFALLLCCTIYALKHVITSIEMNKYKIQISIKIKYMLQFVFPVYWFHFSSILLLLVNIISFYFYLWIFV